MELILHYTFIDLTSTFLGTLLVLYCKTHLMKLNKVFTRSALSEFKLNAFLFIKLYTLSESINIVHVLLGMLFSLNEQMFPLYSINNFTHLFRSILLFCTILLFGMG